MTKNKPARRIPVHQRPSPNYNARRQQLDMIVLHYTGMSSLQEVLNKLTDPESELSAHFVVDTDGRVFQLVDAEQRAWHAGISNWQGQRDINSRSIGVEIMNNGQAAFTDAQMRSVLAICNTMMKKYHIPAHHVVGHSDVAPGRKTDPGPLFPWTFLSQYGVGLYLEPTIGDLFATTGKKGDLAYVRKMLAHIGYGNDFSPNAQPPLRDIVAAFQSRYEPDIYTYTPSKAGIPTHRTVALLRACARAYDTAEADYRTMLKNIAAAPSKQQGPKR